MRITEEGYKLNSLTISQILALALLNNSTLESTSNSEDCIPNGDSVFKYISKLEIEELYKRINPSLIRSIPDSFFNKSYDIAIDITLLEYYGKDENKYIIRSKAKNGTTRFYGYISCYVIKDNKRYTLYVKQLENNYVLVEELEQVLNYVKKYIKIRCLYLDKQFYNIDCVSYLQKNNYKHIIAVAVRGRHGNKLEKLLKSTKKDSIVNYTISKNGKTLDVQLYVVHKEYKNKKGEIEIFTFAYCVNGNVTTLQTIFEDYRKRFGIESSYRIMNDSRIKTVSNNPVLRFLFNTSAFVLINIWITFKLTFKFTSKNKSKFVIMKIFRDALYDIIILALIQYSLAKKVYHIRI